MAILIDGKAIANDVKAGVKEKCEALKAQGITPALAVILVGEDPASQVYVRNKARACKACGMRSEVIRMSADTTQEELLAKIREINADDDPGLVEGRVEKTSGRPKLKLTALQWLTKVSDLYACVQPATA